MLTYAEIADRTSTQIPEHLAAQAEVPVRPIVSQGDVCLFPIDSRHPSQSFLSYAEPLPPEGVNVVVGDIGRNRHILSADAGSGVLWQTGRFSDRVRDYGTLLVPPDDNEDQVWAAVATRTGTDVSHRSWFKLYEEYIQSAGYEAAGLLWHETWGKSGGHRMAVLTHTAEHGSVAVPAGFYRVFGQFDPQTRRRVAD